MKGASATIRKAKLLETPKFSASLVHYPADLRQTAHTHERPQLSYLIVGALNETTSSTDAFSARRSSGFKPAGQRHGAVFGPHGALMLAIDFRDDIEFERPACEWREVGVAEWCLIQDLLQGEQNRQDHASDLVAMAAWPTHLPHSRTSPPWLPKVREALELEPEQARVSALAYQAGVHRAHLTRAFTSAFGISPSVFRSRCLVMKALSSSLKEQGKLANIAADTGFADQSHMARSARAHAGLSVSRVRSLLKDATFIQA